jgi:hypothetical protein
MFRVLRWFTATAVLVVPAFISVPAVSVGASTIQPSKTSTPGDITKPIVKLVGHGSSVTFRPFELSVQDQSPTSCTPLHGEWTMSNTTKQTQPVLIEGHAAFTLKPSGVEHICDGLGTWVFTLTSSPLAQLTVRATTQP